MEEKMERAIERMELREKKLAGEVRRLRAMVVMLAAAGAGTLLVAAADDDEPKDLVVRSLVVVDEEGRERVRIESIGDRPGLFLSEEEWNDIEDSKLLAGIAIADTEGNRRAALWSYDGVASDVVLNGNAEEGAIFLRSVVKGGARLSMMDGARTHQVVAEASDQGAILNAAGGRADRQIAMISSADAAELRVLGGQDAPRASLVSTQEGGGASLLFFQHRAGDPESPGANIGIAAEARPTVNLYDANGLRRASMDLLTDGTPAIEVTDHEGRSAWSTPRIAAPPPPAPPQQPTAPTTGNLGLQLGPTQKVTPKTPDQARPAAREPQPAPVDSSGNPTAAPESDEDPSGNPAR